MKAKISGLALLAVSMTVASAQSTRPKKDIPTIAKAAKEAIVTIVMQHDDKPIALGTGFLVRQDGVIVTNYHVIVTGNVAIVKFADGTISPVDGLLETDKMRDLAVIKIHGRSFQTLPLGNSDQTQVGEDVVAIGNPLGLELSVSNGILSGVRNDEREGGKFLQTTAPISHGSSGGPLLNMFGEVIGINSMFLEGGENLNFAIPINDAKRLISDIPAPTKPGQFDFGFGMRGLPNEPATPPEAANGHPSSPENGRGHEIEIKSPQFKYYEALLLEGKNVALTNGTYACFDDDPKSTFFWVLSAHVEGQSLFVAVILFQNGVQSSQMPQAYLGDIDWNSGVMRLPRPVTRSSAADQAIHGTDHLDWSSEQITIETAFGGPSDPMQSDSGYYAIRFVLQRSSLRFAETFSARGSVYDGLVKARTRFTDPKSPRSGQCIQIPGSRTPEESR